MPGRAYPPTKEKERKKAPTLSNRQYASRRGKKP